jgi:hypothetical protein
MNVESDLRIILWIQAVRAFLYGFGAVILGSVLAHNGASDLEVGLLGAAILAGMALSALAVGIVGGRARGPGGARVGAPHERTPVCW